VTLHPPLADIGLTLGGVLVIIVVWLGIVATVAFVAAGLAVAVIGPRRWDAVLVPGLVTLVALVAILVLGRLTMAEAPVVLIAAFGTALGAAALQLVAIQRLGDVNGGGRFYLFGGCLAGAGFGSVLGGIAGTYAGTQTLASSLAIVGGVMGASIGAARGRQFDAVARESNGNTAEPDPRRLVVALDGPASSGKSSVGAAAALELGYRFCDTGLLYRAATWLALRRSIPADGDAARLVALVQEIELVPDANGRLAHVTVDGEDVTAEVHTPIVDEGVSAISRVPELRAALLDRQRSLAAQPGGIIMAGRDIGTVVLPDADLKLFLDASVEERARRRAEERRLDPGGPDARAILEQLRRRDDLDRNRAVAPLRPAPDAIHIVTDGNEFDETVASVVAAIREAERSGATEPAGRS
jgi:cytidylate kinase